MAKKKSADEKASFALDPGTPSIGTLRATMEAINKHFGTGTIKKGNEFPTVDRIPTGIPWLDMALGGGIPKGRISLFSGDPSTCKTLIAELVIANNQAAHPEEPIVRCDVEGVFDPRWARQLGSNPDLEDYYLHQPDTAEEGLDVMDTVVRSMNGGVFLLDSIAMLTPQVEVEESLTSWQRSIGARLVNKALRKLQAAMNKAGKTASAPTIILINQERTGMDSRGNSYTVRPYGKGQDFAASVIIESRLGKEIRWNSKGKLVGWSDKQDDFGDPVGRWIKFHIAKNKTAPPYRRGEYEIYTAFAGQHAPHVVPGCSNEHEQVAVLAERHGILQRAGAWYTLLGEKVQGRAAVVDMLINRGDLYGETYELVMTAEREWALGKTDVEVRSA